MIRIYRQLFTAQFQAAAQYRIQFLLWMLFSVIRPTIFMAAWVAVAAVERDPGERPGLRRGRSPLRDEGGLAEPRRCVHEHELRGGLCEFFDECRPLHPFGPDTRRIELGLDRRIQPRQDRGHRRIGAKSLPRLPSCAESTAMVHSVETNKQNQVWLGMMRRVRSRHSARPRPAAARPIGNLYNA